MTSEEMKIVATSNFDEETFSEYVVAEKVMNSHVGKIMTKALNDDGGEHSPVYYQLVAPDYKLYEWEPR